MMTPDETAPVISGPASSRAVGRGRVQSSPLRVGIIGCGAVAELGYMPAIAELKSVSAHTLIDRNPARAAALAERWSAAEIGRELADAIGKVDAAVVATPNYLHASMASHLLREGIPVLVEKPMGLTVHECDRMLAAAQEGGAPLAVGFVCRFSRAARLAKELVRQGCFGPVRSFYAENGGVFGWPVTSDYLFRREAAGGGVLIDLGSHLLDLLIWWMGPVKDLLHCDDSAGGVEADSLTHLQMKSGASGKMRLSRTCRMRQGILLDCERASLCVHLGRPALEVRLKNSSLHLESEVREIARPAEPRQTFIDMLAAQVEDWAEAIRDGREPAADGRAGREVTAVIERCYAERQPWRLPWLRR